MEMSRLTRDGTTTAEPVSRDQILRRERGHGIFIFSVQLTTSRISNLTRLILTLSICDDLYTPPVLSTCPLHTNSGRGKERRILIGP